MKRFLASCAIVATIAITPRVNAQTEQPCLWHTVTWADGARTEQCLTQLEFENLTENAQVVKIEAGVRRYLPLVAQQ